jgi:hypothetical protein
VMALFRHAHAAGQIQRIVQFRLRLPESKAQLRLAREQIRETTPPEQKARIINAREAWQRREPELHWWVQVEWHKAAEPEAAADFDEVEEKRLAMVPEFLANEFETDAVQQWLPVQALLCNFVALVHDLPQRSRAPGRFPPKQKLSACMLPRDISM